MNVVLIDDEQIALDFFQLQLKKMNNVNVMGAYVNPEEGMQTILTKEVDAVFLDIHMPGEDGVSLAKRILETNPNIIIVFVTAFEQYAVHAFEINALDYIVKPVRQKRLHETIDRVREKIEWNHSEESPIEKDKLRVQMCKQFHIKAKGDNEQKIRWRTARTKELFLLLLQNREQVVNKEEIIELLWPEVDFERANAQLYTTVYHIRKVIKQLGDHFKLENNINGYILFTRDTEIDVDQWEDTIQTLPQLNNETIVEYEQAMKLYSDNYLKDHHYVWAIPEAERLDRKWVKIALEISQQYEKSGKLTEAYHWNKYICTRYPDVEEAHFAVMRYLAAQGKCAYVDHQYRTLVDSLEEDLGVQPSGYVTKWYNKWKAQSGNIQLRVVRGEVEGYHEEV